MHRWPALLPILLLGLAQPAQAEPWRVTRTDEACHMAAPLSARRAPDVALGFRHEGDRLLLVVDAPEGTQLASLQVDRRRFALPAHAPGEALEQPLAPELEAALARGRRARLSPVQGRPWSGRLAGAGAALEALKDCAEPLRLAKLPRLAGEEAAAIGAFDDEADLARQAALAEARRLYQRDRLARGSAAAVAGALAAETRTYHLPGQAPIVCTANLTTFDCR